MNKEQYSHSKKKRHRKRSVDNEDKWKAALTSWWAETGQQTPNSMNKKWYLHPGKQRYSKRDQQTTNSLRMNKHSQTGKQKQGGQQGNRINEGQHSHPGKERQHKRGCQVAKVTTWKGSTHIEPHIRKCCHTFANYFFPLFLPTSKHRTSPKIKLRLFSDHSVICMKTLTLLQQLLCSAPDFPFAPLRAWHWQCCRSRHSQSFQEVRCSFCLLRAYLRKEYQPQKVQFIFPEPHSPGAQNGAILPTCLDIALGRLAPPLHVPRFPN